MPLYEYKCDKCNEVFEVMQKFSDAPLETHDKCGGTVRRLLSVPALQFKGTGWYVTDYGRSGSSGSNGKSRETKSSDSGSKAESTATSGDAAKS